jgi:serine/threonine protein kinase
VAAGSGDEALIQMIASAGVIGGRYANLSPLDTGGAGAFSLAFTADDLEARESVFLKFLHPGHNGDYRGKSFHREVELHRRLVGKENIVQIRGGPGELELQLTHAATGFSLPVPCHYFALERAHQDFASYLLKHGRSPALYRRLDVVHDVAKGVNRLHQAGFCHRDLKPDNILLFRGGAAKLGDLGTCRSLSQEEPHLDRYAGPVGALAYAAPEMLCGGWEVRELYCGADWFAVGAILFEAVTAANLYVAVGMRSEDLLDMVRHFGQLPEEARLQRFRAIVSDIAGEYPIPSVRDFAGTDIHLARSSNATLSSLDRVIRSLCHFDYTRRTVAFSAILRGLDICGRHAVLDERERAKRLMRGKRS